jgi:hypothetical protein
MEERSRKMRQNKDFRCVIQIIKQISQKRNKQSKSKNQITTKQIGNGLNRITKILNSKPNGMTHGRPIIIVPNEIIKGNLNMFNALEFFNNKYFVEVRTGEAKNSKYEKWVPYNQKKKATEIFSYPIANKNIGFEIWDDLRLVKQRNRIESVVAIFVKGTQFEFKNIEKIFGYKDVATLFDKVKGFYLYSSGFKINPIVAKWNVTKFELHPSARHKDSLLLRTFWNKVNGFLLNP